MNVPPAYDTYAGPVRDVRPTQPERCLIPECRALLTNDDKRRKAWLCETHADPEGYSARLKAAQAAARQRCLEAYPVCAGCGKALPDQAVKEGITRHYSRACGGTRYYDPIHTYTP